jgi:DNA polymerase-3 subunit epsilon
MDPTLERMTDALAESGDYRVIRRLQPQTEYHPADDNPKLVADVVDVETTGIDPERDKIIELGMCVFEYGRGDGRIYRVIGSWDWLEDPGIPIPPEITRLTGITEQMFAGQCIDDAAVNDLLGNVALVIAHHAAFDRGFLERRLPAGVGTDAGASHGSSNSIRGAIGVISAHPPYISQTR